jgi:hypothetical protein
MAVESEAAFVGDAVRPGGMAQILLAGPLAVTGAKGWIRLIA